MHRTKRVFESRVLRAGINQVRARELLYSPQTLERSSVQKFSFDIGETDISMNWIGDFSGKPHSSI
jgi:hypothetical protein